MSEVVRGNFERRFYPACHGASGYVAGHVPTVLPYEEAKPSEAEMLVSNLQSGWCAMVLSPLRIFGWWLL